MTFDAPPRGPDGRFAEKPEVGIARRLTERLREHLGHDGRPDNPPVEGEPVTETASTEDLFARLDAQMAAPVEPVELGDVAPLLADVPSLASAAMVLGVNTVPEAAQQILTLGKAAPTHLLLDAADVLATERKAAASWDPKLHPRDRDGQFISIGAVLNLLGSVGGGSGKVVGNGPNNHVVVEKADGTRVDVPAAQTYHAGEATRIGKPGAPGSFNKPSSFTDAANPDTPGAPKPADENRITPEGLPNDKNELYRALQSNKATGNDPDRMAINAAAAGIGATGDGREFGRALAQRAKDQETNNRIAEMTGSLTKIADELDADGVTVETAGGQKLSDYLRDYAAGFNEIHDARIGVTDQVAAEAQTVDWGKPYGGDGPAYVTPDGPVFMRRKGQKVRFFDQAGNQVGPEQPNVAPATAYAHSQGWTSPSLDAAGIQPPADGVLHVDGVPVATVTHTDLTSDVVQPRVSPMESLNMASSLQRLADEHDLSTPEGRAAFREALQQEVAGLSDADLADFASGMNVDAAGRGRLVAGVADKITEGRGDPSDLDAPSVQPQYDEANHGPTPEFVHKGLRNIPLTRGDTMPPATGTPDDPIDVQGDLDAALQHLAEGRHVRLNQPDEVATLLDKVREIVAEAKASGDQAPTYDLCLVSVPGTNLFCAEHQGIPRVEMPQLGGVPLPNTPADKLPKNDFGGVDLTDQFIEALQGRGVSVDDRTVPASHLRASQMQLDGAKVSGIAAAMESGDAKSAALNDMPIFVTRDGYVIDGHHRWAAKVGLDIGDNHLGDIDMNVRVVDMDIGEALDFANAFSQRMGIPGADVADNPVADAEAPVSAGEFKDTEFSLANPEGAAEAQTLADELASLAESNEPTVTPLIVDAVTGAGGRMDGLQNRLKQRSTMRDKIARKSAEKGITPQEQAAALNDALRYTAILDPADYIETAQGIVDGLAQNGYEPSVLNNSWPKNDDYSGVNMTLVSPDGLQIELQFHTEDSFFTKSDVHADYEIANNRDGKRSLKEQRDAYARMAARWDTVEQPKGWEGFGTIKFNPPPSENPAQTLVGQQIDALQARLDATTSEALRASLQAQIDDLNAGLGGVRAT